MSSSAPWSRSVRLLLGAGGLLAASRLPAEVTKPLKVEIAAAEIRSLAVENLVGSLTVRPGPAGKVIATATLHAENRDLAEAVRLERATGRNGETVLHVRYPLDRVSRIRYPLLGEPDDDLFFLRFLSFTFTREDYDGHSVRIGNHGGKLLYADLEIQVPPECTASSFRNLVGRIDAEGIQGRLHFGTSSADLKLDRLRGDLRIEGTSGDIEADDIEGSWESHFTSGDLRLSRFRGSTLSFSASSGDLRARAVAASTVSVRTTSGDVRLEDSEIRELTGRASSGDIELDLKNPDVARVDVQTTSGDVTLRLPSSAAFEASAEHGSGDVRVDFPGSVAVDRGGSRERYRHGSGGAQIEVRTRSGDFTLASR